MPSAKMERAVFQLSTKEPMEKFKSLNSDFTKDKHLGEATLRIIPIPQLLSWSVYLLYFKSSKLSSQGLLLNLSHILKTYC